MNNHQKTENILKKYHKQYVITKYWTWLVCLFFLTLTGAMLYSSWLFTTTTEALDAQALPTFETNTARLREINTDVTASEKAIEMRTASETTSLEDTVL